MYKIRTLGNQIRVVTEKIDYVKSVSMGVWIGAGSAMESKENNGVSHFIEHMLFKGTTTRSARDIAEYMDRVGGQLNAVTAKEYTCFYAKTLSDHAHMSVEILSDMIKNSTHAEENIETERKVIFEEINMCEDTPEDAIHDHLSRLMWRENPIGFSIAGTINSLGGINRDAIISYYDKFYCGENIVISVVGNFDEDKMLELIEQKFGDIKPHSDFSSAQDKICVERGGRIITKDIEQCHVCIGFEGVSRGDDAVYDLLVMNAVLGGNVSSRLFQKVREELGLAYSVYSYVNQYKNNGSLVIYAGLNTENTCDAMTVINNELKRLSEEKLSHDETEVVKEQMKASLIMGLESMSARMSNYGKAVLFDNHIKSQDDIIKLIDNVNTKTIAEVIERVLRSDAVNTVVLGKGNIDTDILNAIDF